MSYVLKYSGSICGGWGWLDSYHANSLLDCKEACFKAGKSKCNWFAYNEHYRKCRPVPGTCSYHSSSSGYSIYMPYTPAPTPTPTYNSHYSAPAPTHSTHHSSHHSAPAPEPAPKPTPSPVQKTEK